MPDDLLRELSDEELAQYVPLTDEQFAEVADEGRAAWKAELKSTRAVQPSSRRYT